MMYKSGPRRGPLPPGEGRGYIMKQRLRRLAALVIVLALVFQTIPNNNQARADGSATVIKSGSFELTTEVEQVSGKTSLQNIDLSDCEYAVFNFSWASGDWGGGAVCYQSISKADWSNSDGFSNEGKTSITIYSSDIKADSNGFKTVEVQSWWVNGTTYVEYKLYTSGSGSGGSQSEEPEIPDYSSAFTAQTIPSNYATNFVSGIKVGWNLGNQFEAWSDGYSGNELDIESMWCHANATEELFDSLIEQGFNAVRIPVTWRNHIDSDFNISSAWMSRIKEVVGWAYDKGLYVILDVHHDIGQNYYYPDSAHYESSAKFLKKVWTQIADEFADFGEKLIFEGINEPRLVGTSSEWWIDYYNKDSTYTDAMKSINKLNQVFVDTVRADEAANNKSRFLMVGSYATSQNYALQDEFVLPTDTAKNRLIVTVHMYLSYQFAMYPNDGSSTSEFNNTAKSENLDNFKKLYDKFVSKGIPVIVGEFGATDKNNDEERIKYYSYMSAAMKSYGIRGFVWDNNAFNPSGLPEGEKYGLIDRASGNAKKPSMIKALTQYYDDTFTVVLGDVNLDSDVNIADLTALARHVAGIEELVGEEKMANADVNQDDVVDIKDLTRLARHVAEIEPLF